MQPREHVFASLIFISFLYFLFNLSLTELTIIFLASILIDLDHYFRFILKTGKISPFKFMEWSRQETKKFCKTPKNKLVYPIFIFHGIEFLLILLILTPYFKFITPILIGIIFHMILDTINSIKKGYPDIKISQIYNIIRNKKIKR